MNILKLMLYHACTFLTLSIAFTGGTFLNTTTHPLQYCNRQRESHLHIQQYSHRDIWQRRSYIWCKCHRSRQVSPLAVFSQKLKKSMLYLSCNLRSFFLSPTIYCCIRTKCNGREDSCLPSIAKSTEYLPNFSSFNP